MSYYINNYVFNRGQCNQIYYIMSSIQIEGLMHNIVSQNQLRGWNHSLHASNTRDDNTTRLNDYYACMVASEQDHTSKQICKDILQWIQIKYWHKTPRKRGFFMYYTCGSYFLSMYNAIAKPMDDAPATIMINGICYS